MKRLIRTSRSVFMRTLIYVSLVLFVVLGVISLANLNQKVAQAASSNYINFQARILNSNGSVVPDGLYDVEFKIYDVNSGGASLWTETYNGANQIRTVNGYVSTSLGSVHPFDNHVPNWDDDLWISLNINSDGEMNPRMRITAVPHAMSASKLQVDNGTYGSSLSFTDPTVGNQSFLLPDLASATSATIITTGNLASITGVGTLTSGSWHASTIDVDHGGTGATTFTQYGVLYGNGTSAFGVTTVGTTGQCLISGNGTAAPTWGDCASGSAGSYIQNQNAIQQATSNFWISGTGRADTSLSTPLVVNGSTADNILTLQGNSAAAGNTATSPNIQFKVGNSGATTAMTILNNGNVGIGTASPTAARLAVKGTTSDNTASVLNLTNSNDSNILVVQNDGKIAINGAIDNNTTFKVNSTWTSPMSSAPTAIKAYSTYNVTADSPSLVVESLNSEANAVVGAGYTLGKAVGMAGFAMLTNGGAGSTITYATAVNGEVRLIGATGQGTITNARAIEAGGPDRDAGNTGTITNAYGLYVQNQGTNFVSNAYGIYIREQTGATTSNYSIYSVGGANYFGGTVTSNGLLTGNAGLTTTGGAVSLTGNAASSLTTSAGALTLTSAAATTWSTTAGNLTLQAGSGTVSLGTSTSLTATGALSITSGGANALSVDAGGAAALNLGTTNATTLNIGRTASTFTLTGSQTSSIIASNGTNTITVNFANPTANVIYQFGATTAGTYNICTSANDCGGSYILNQTSLQASSNFHISGTGVADTSFSTPLLFNGTTADNILTLQGNSAVAGNTATSPNIQFKVGNSGATTAMTILNNGNVGIGTNSPTTAKLVVKGLDATSSNASLNITNSNDLSLLYVRNDGNVGIGTTNPSTYKLLVSGTRNTNIFGVTDGTATGGIYIDNTYSTAPVQFGTITNSNLGFFTNNSLPQMVLNTSGNLGVGNTSPTTARVVVKGSDSTSANASLNVTNSADGSLIYVRNDGYIGLNTTAPVAGLDVKENSLAVSYGVQNYTASKSGTTITATVSTFSARDVGRYFIWADGTVDRITDYISPTQVTVASSGTIASQSGSTRNVTLGVDTAGNNRVGINTANPQTVFDVRTSSTFRGNAIQFTESSDNTSIRLYRTIGGATDEAVPWWIENNGSGSPYALLFKTGSSAAIGTETVTTAMALTATGVGIGNIANPTGKLHVYTGNTLISSTSYNGYFENLAQNSATDGINKYGIYVTSTGTWSGGGGAATNNYGLYVATPSGGDNNYAIYTAGGTSFFGGNINAQNTSTITMQIQSAAAADTMFTVDTTNNRVKVGNDTGTGTATTALILDSASTNAGMGTVNGSMYYDTATGRIQCYESGAWGNCGNTTLQEAYTSSTGGTTPEMLLDTTRNGVDIQDANTTLGNTVALLAVRASATATTLGGSLFQVNNNAGIPLVGIGLGTQAVSTGIDLQFGGSSNRTIQVLQNSSAGTGRNLTIKAGQGNAGVGGQLYLYGGDGNGTNMNGGNINLSGGTPSGSGVLGIVNLSPTVFNSVTPTFTITANNQTVAVALADVNSFSTILVNVGSTYTGTTVSLPDPTTTSIGRILYISAADGVSDFTLSANSGGSLVNIAMRKNTTATMIWNGTDWTAAGASSSTTLQAAYDNTLTSAGGAEIILNNTASSDGFTVRNNATNPIAGAIFEVQSSIGSNLFSVNNVATELVANGGAETSATFSTDWTAAPAGGTVSRNVALANVATGQASAQVITTTTNHGIRNNLTTNLAISTTYQVSFTAKISAGTAAIEVLYSRNGGTNTVACANYSTQTLLATGWSKVTCTFTTDSTAATNPDLIIRQTDATGRTIYVDNLSVTLSNTTSVPSNVQIGGGIYGGPVTLLTLDRSSTPPVANGNTTYLGSMYYDTTSGRIQCYEADGWGACGSAPDNYVNLIAEYPGAVLNGTGVGTMTADFCANQSGVLQINDSFCATGQALNYYKWTSPQATEQTYSIYVTYQLPAAFKNFASDNTVTLSARTSNTTDGIVTYQMYRSEGGALNACGTETTVTSTANTWQTVPINGNESTTCGFSSSTANNNVIFKINVKAKNNATVYVGTLSFTTVGQ